MGRLLLLKTLPGPLSIGWDCFHSSESLPSLCSGLGAGIVVTQTWGSSPEYHLCLGLWLSCWREPYSGLTFCLATWEVLSKCLWIAGGPSPPPTLPQGRIALPLPFPLQPQITFTLKTNIALCADLYLYSQSAVSIRTQSKIWGFLPGSLGKPFPFIHTHSMPQ